MSLQFERESALKLIIQRLSSLVAYLLEVIKKKDDKVDSKYRLVDWVEKKGIGYCKVHVIGTSLVHNYTPREIVADDNFISGFGHLDIRTITNLANAEEYKSKISIVSICHEEKIIEIKSLDKEKSFIKIDEKIQDHIEKFSKKDAFKLGRLVGENDVLP